MAPNSKVISFNQKKNEAIERRRREFERLVFDQYLGVYSMIDDEEHSIEVKMRDISLGGCMLEVPAPPVTLELVEKGRKDYTGENFGPFRKDSVLNLRFYFTLNSYVPVEVTIKYCKRGMSDDHQPVLLCGCSFENKNSRFVVIESFIDFISSLAEHAVAERSSQVYHGEK